MYCPWLYIDAEGNRYWQIGYWYWIAFRNGRLSYRLSNKNSKFDGAFFLCCWKFCSFPSRNKLPLSKWPIEKAIFVLLLGPACRIRIKETENQVGSNHLIDWNDFYSVKRQPEVVLRDSKGKIAVTGSIQLTVSPILLFRGRKMCQNFGRLARNWKKRRKYDEIKALTRENDWNQSINKRKWLKWALNVMSLQRANQRAAPTPPFR